MSERTISVTFGRWGGVYAHGCRWLWRVCFGWVAVTYFNGEFTQAMRLWMMYEPKNGAHMNTDETFAKLFMYGSLDKRVFVSPDMEAPARKVVDECGYGAHGATVEVPEVWAKREGLVAAWDRLMDRVDLP